METRAHCTLKMLAIEFLRSLGCQAVATEVSCPIARYRLDVAGYLDTVPVAEPRRAGPRRRRCKPQTVLIECKQSRVDFLRDRRDTDRLLRLREELHRIRRHIEERRIKVNEPHLRCSGSSLFPELEVWDFSASRSRGYRRVLGKIRRLERQLYGETKFFTIARYRLADQLYVAAPWGMIRRRELPCGWGLLEYPRRRLTLPHVAGGRSRGALRVAVEAPPQATRTALQLRLLRNIAVAASRTIGATDGIEATRASADATGASETLWSG